MVNHRRFFSSVALPIEPQLQVGGELLGGGCHGRPSRVNG